MNFDYELQRLIEEALDAGVTEEEMVGELELAAQDLREQNYGED